MPRGNDAEFLNYLKRVPRVKYSHALDIMARSYVRRESARQQLIRLIDRGTLKIKGEYVSLAAPPFNVPKKPKNYGEQIYSFDVTKGQMLLRFLTQYGVQHYGMTDRLVLMNIIRLITEQLKPHLDSFQILYDMTHYGANQEQLAQMLEDLTKEGWITQRNEYESLDRLETVLVDILGWKSRTASHLEIPAELWYEAARPTKLLNSYSKPTQEADHDGNDSNDQIDD